jgi:hypothetical protein
VSLNHSDAGVPSGHNCWFVTFFFAVAMTHVNASVNAIIVLDFIAFDVIVIVLWRKISKNI